MNDIYALFLETGACEFCVGVQISRCDFGALGIECI